MTAAAAPEALERGRRFFASGATFVMGVAKIEQLPDAAIPEIAFAGRSNVGKSSLINALTGMKDLARASNTPGRTRELNYFLIGGRLHLVDMPGYGYAKAAKKDVKVWQRLLTDYLKGRVGLTRAFVLIDSRHGIMTADREMFDLLDEAAVPYQLVLTKTDKWSASELAKIVADTEAAAKTRAACLPQVFVTSSETGAGIADLRAEIAALAA